MGGWLGVIIVIATRSPCPGVGWVGSVGSDGFARGLGLGDMGTRKLTPENVQDPWLKISRPYGERRQVLEYQHQSQYNLRVEVHK